MVINFLCHSLKKGVTQKIPQFKLWVTFNTNSPLHFCEKKLKPQRSSKSLFSLQTHRRTYVNLYSFERSLK